MTSEQLKKAFNKIGVTNVTSIPEVLKKLRMVEFNNGGVLHIKPNDTSKKLIEIDYADELIVLEELVCGRWRRQVKTFETIETVSGLTGIKPPCIEYGIIENEDGTETDLANGDFKAVRTTNLQYMR